MAILGFFWENKIWTCLKPANTYDKKTNNNAKRGTRNKLLDNIKVNYSDDTLISQQVWVDRASFAPRAHYGQCTSPHQGAFI